ncbi:hypothetical protein QC762_001410 [Podospora pseudocomata]|uniref:Uncharacterized protein n=1 Tax=Podospora pseudocomata TaxID=2093779 RepID=A0ABR0G238_9PEZI|nr:hypothetical protein QC762_001410 [Podospora pseudocomata]
MSPSDTSYNYYSDTSTGAYSESDPRNCLISGCRRKHAFARVGGRKIYSEFCNVHTCERTFPLSKGLHCPNPKREHERFCSVDLSCGHPDCSQTGSYSSSAEWTQYFCPRHRCTMRGCLAGSTNKRQQQRCDLHILTCNVPRCERPCYENRDGTLDIVCAAHYGSFNCAWAGCARRKPGYDTKYCLEHKCAFGECSHGRERDAKWCKEHKCAISSCDRGVRENGGVMCKDHECNSSRCRLPRMTGVDFCTDHGCKGKNCRFKARFPGGYCEERHACIVGMCSNPRSTVMSSTLGIFTDRCVEHDRLNRVGRRLSTNDMPERERWEGRRHRYSDDIESMRRRELERLQKEQREREEREAHGPMYAYSGWDRR